MKKLFYTLSGLFLFASCAFNSDFYFDDDFSGKVVNQIDISGLIAFADDESDSLELGIQEGIDEKKDSLVDAFNQKEGISNADVYYREGVMTFEYEFEDLESLNSFGSSVGEADENLNGFMLSQGNFSMEDGVFEFVESPDTDEMLQDTSFTKMLEFMELTNTFHFEDKVKSTSNSEYIISEDGRSVSNTQKGEEITNPEKGFGTKVEFK